MVLHQKNKINGMCLDPNFYLMRSHIPAYILALRDHRHAIGTMTSVVACITCQNLPDFLPPSLRSGSKVKVKISREGEGLGTRLGHSRD